MRVLMVSDNFVECYKKLNVIDVVDKLKSLNKRELYLFIINCLDRHDINNDTVLYNIRDFFKEIMEVSNVINRIVDDNMNNSKFNLITNLINDLENCEIVDKNNNRLTEPFDRYKIRNIKIDLLLKRKY